MPAVILLLRFTALSWVVYACACAWHVTFPSSLPRLCSSPLTHHSSLTFPSSVVRYRRLRLSRLLATTIPHRRHLLCLATPYPTSSSSTWPGPRDLNPSSDLSPLNPNRSLLQSHTTPRPAVQSAAVPARLHHPSSTLPSPLVRTTQITAIRSRMSPPTMKASSSSSHGNANARLRHPCLRPPCQIRKETPCCQTTGMPLPCVTALHSQ